MKAKYLSLLALSALIVGCGPSSTPSTPTNPSTEPSTEPSVEPFVPYDSVGIIGSMTDWSNEIALETVDGGHVWSLSNVEFHKGDMWKVRANGSWDIQWDGSKLDEVSATLFEVVTSDYNNIKVLESGYYTVTVNVDTDSVSATLDEVIAPTFAEAVEGAKAAHSSVASGSLNYRSNFTEAPDWSNMFTYQYGSDKNGDVTYVSELPTYEGGSPINEIFGYTSSGSAYAVKLEDDGSVSQSYTEITSTIMYGPEVTIINYGVSFNGAQGLLEAIAEMYAEVPTSSYVVNEDGDYVVSTFATYINEGYAQYNKLFEITATFGFADNGALVKANATIEAYDNIAEDLETGTWVKTEESTLTGTEVVEATQVVGEKTWTNPVDIDGYFYSDFDIVDDAGNVVTEVTVNAGGSLEYYIANATPDTASASIDTIKVTVVEGGENEINAYYNSWYGSLNIYTNGEGRFVLEVASTNVKKTIVVNVTAARAEQIYLWVCSPLPSGSHDTTTDTRDGSVVTVYEGTHIFLQPSVSPAQADQEVTYTTSGTAATVEDVYDFKMGPYSDEAYAIKVTGVSVGDITMTITAVKAPEVTMTITIRVVAAPSLNDLVANDYVSGYNGRKNAFVDFTPDADPATGKVYIMCGDVDGTYSYSYNATDRTFSITDGDNNPVDITLAFTSSYKLFAKSGWSEYTMSVYTSEFEISGFWEAYQLFDQETFGLSNSYFSINIDPSSKTAYFDFGVNNKNWESIVSISASSEYTIAEDGTFSFSSEAYDVIYGNGEITSVSFKFSADFTTLHYEVVTKTYGTASGDIVR